MRSVLATIKADLDYRSRAKGHGWGLVCQFSHRNPSTRWNSPVFACDEDDVERHGLGRRMMSYGSMRLTRAPPRMTEAVMISSSTPSPAETLTRSAILPPNEAVATGVSSSVDPWSRKRDLSRGRRFGYPTHHGNNGDG